LAASKTAEKKIASLAAQILHSWYLNNQYSSYYIHDLQPSFYQTPYDSYLEDNGFSHWLTILEEKFDNRTYYDGYNHYDDADLDNFGSDKVMGTTENKGFD
jgi:hypothetical protein